MIELHRVSKIYAVGPLKVPALSDVSFRVDKGEFVVLAGPSGAGKTTLLRLLYRAELPSEREVEVLCAHVNARHPRARLRRAPRRRPLLARPGLPGAALAGRGAACRARARHRAEAPPPARR